MVVHGGHFGGNPAAHGGAYQDDVLEAQGVDEHVVEMGHVRDGLDPIGGFGAVETGLAGHVHGVLGGQVLVPGEPAVGTAGAVEENQWGAAAAGVHFDSGAVDIYGSAGTTLNCCHTLVPVRGGDGDILLQGYRDVKVTGRGQRFGVQGIYVPLILSRQRTRPWFDKLAMSGLGAGARNCEQLPIPEFPVQPPERGDAGACDLMGRVSVCLQAAG